MTTKTDERVNIHQGEWGREMQIGPFSMRGRQVGAEAGATDVGMGIFEVDPGKSQLPYHAHHAIEEVIVALQGEVTVRTPSGEVTLAEGDVHVCPKGPEGAHRVENKTDAIVRLMIVSSKAEADIIEYPDSDKVMAVAGEWGTDRMHRWLLDGTATKDYLDGELD